jgi:hypothetical protein
MGGWLQSRPLHLFCFYLSNAPIPFLLSRTQCFYETITVRTLEIAPPSHGGGAACGIVHRESGDATVINSGQLAVIYTGKIGRCLLGFDFQPPRDKPYMVIEST